MKKLLQVMMILLTLGMLSAESFAQIDIGIGVGIGGGGGSNTGNDRDRDRDNRNNPPPRPRYENFTLDLRRVYYGRDQIDLTRELEREYRRRDFNRYELVEATLYAKSKYGDAEVYLEVGRKSSRTEFIPGNRRDFRSRGNYERVELLAPYSRSSDWVLQFPVRDDEVDVDRVVVKLERVGSRPRPNPRPGNVHFSTVSKRRFEKVELTHDYHVNRDDVYEVKIVVDRNTVFINNARIVYYNGDVERADSLIGSFREGDRAVFRIPGRRGRGIRKVELTGSTNLFGSRGEVELQVGQ